MKLRAATIASVLLTAWLSPAPAQQSRAVEEERYPRLRFGLDAVSAWQSLNHTDDAASMSNLSSGIHAALGNMHIIAALAEGIDVYAELYLSSKHHPGAVYDREGWVRISKLPEGWDMLGLNNVFRYIDIKAGHFETDFGNQHLTRSDNAQVQNNPLIGNYLVDPNTVEAGVEVIGTVGGLNLLAGLGNGVTVEDFQPGRGYSVHGKIWYQPHDSLFNLAASAYRVDHSSNPTGGVNRGSGAEFFAGNRSGSRYSGVIRGGADAGQLLLGRGQNLTAWQLDGVLNLEPLRLSGLIGRMEDEDINGSDAGEPREEATYYGAEVQYNVLFGMAYLAGRYSGASVPTYRGTAMDARVDRFQIGLGLRLLDYMLVKGEYVNQRYSGFTTDFVQNPRFSGFLLEASASF